MSTIKTNTIQPTAAGNNLIFANGSAAETMRITDAGLVGVGTNNPVSKLHIKIPSGGGTSLSDMNLLSNYSLVLDATAAVGSGSTPGYNSAGIAFAATSQNATQPFASIFYGGQANGGSLNFATSTTYANGLNNINMCMHNGLVGIGTVAPLAKLHIVGGAAEALLLTAGTTGDVGLRVYEDADTAGFLRFRPISSTQKGFVFSNDGDTGILNINTLSSRVGIGITAPAVALDVAGSIKASTSLILGDVNATMAAPNGSAPIFGARAWAYIPSSTASGTQPASSGNIASITRFPVSGVERLTKVTFITPMPHANYAVVGMARLADSLSNQAMVLISPGYVSAQAIQPNTTTEMYYTVWDSDTVSTGYNQRADVSLVIYC